MSSHRPNRLIDELSPYLRQHAHNPVDWRPWGDEAFEEARRRDVPVLVSVGYSTCYWCHVMERESFEDVAIAQIMNDRLVCVKVDREERPDVDHAYMTALLMMRGHGGWPMNVFVEPEGRRPFFAGTYFPPHATHAMVAWPDVVTRVADAYASDRAAVLEQAAQVASSVAENPDHAVSRIPSHADVAKAAGDLLAIFDRTHGGFGRAPKFPQPALIEFLLDVFERAADEPTREAVRHAVTLTLERMALGGINDQIGGGFHRYSVDERWGVPHFEKMLSDNALLAAAYARASVVLNDAWFASVARATAGFVLRELAAESGAFLSSVDAESEGREGLNYLWTPPQIRAALAPADASFAERVFGLESGPNFRDPHHPDAPPTSVLVLVDRPERLASSMGLPLPDFEAQRRRVSEAMLAVRNARALPAIDDKIICSWNALMIGALADLGHLLGEKIYIDAARRAGAFLLTHLVRPDGTLVRCHRAGRWSGEPTVEDYACVASAAVALSRVDDSPRWRTLFETMTRTVSRDYFDAQDRLSDVPANRTDVFARLATLTDGAIPSGASIFAFAALGARERWGASAAPDLERMLSGTLFPAIAASPVNTVNALRTLIRLPASSLGQHAPPPSAHQRVVVLADRERVIVASDAPGHLRLAVQIPRGHHVAAAVASAAGRLPGLSPLRLDVHGNPDVRVYADYPPGRPLDDAGDGPLGALLVYDADIEFDAVIERTGPTVTRAILTLSYQVCTQSECLPPTTVELDVAIDLA